MNVFYITIYPFIMPRNIHEIRTPYTTYYVIIYMFYNVVHLYIYLLSIYAIYIYYILYAIHPKPHLLGRFLRLVVHEAIAVGVPRGVRGHLAGEDVPEEAEGVVERLRQ